MTHMDIEHLTGNLWGPVYAVCATALMICLFLLTLRGERGRVSPEKRNRTDLLLGIAGILLLSLSFGVGMLLTGRDNDTGEWARSMFLAYYKAAVPLLLLFCFVLAMASLGALSSPRLKKGLLPRLRVWANLSASALFLLLTPFYASVTVKQHVYIHLLILVSGVGAALLFRLLLPLEYRAGRENPSVSPQKGISR